MASKYRVGDIVNGLKLLSRQGSDADNRSMWECLCVCGNTVVRNSAQLVSSANDCGCRYKTEKIGEKHKCLTVVGFKDNPHRNTRIWDVACACGDKRDYTTANLTLAKKAGDCGCGYSQGYHPGKKIGKVTLLEYKGITGRYKKRSWVCKCDCGHVFETQTVWLKSGGKTCWKNCKPNPRRMSDGEAAFLALERIYTRNKRGIAYKLNTKLFRKLVTSNCFYCDAPPAAIKKGMGKNNDFIYNGVDRIDSSKPYIKNNVVSCCKTCNYMKRSLLQEDFYGHIRKIYAYKNLGSNST